MKSKQQPELLRYVNPVIFFILLAVMVYSGYIHEGKTKVPVVDHLQVKNHFVELWLGVLCLLWGGVTLMRKRMVLSDNRLSYGLMALAGLAIASLVWSVFTGHTVTKLFLWFGAGGYLFLFYQTVEKEQQLDYILMGVFWAAVVSSFIGWGQYLFDWQLVAQAATPSSTFGNKNMACHMAVLGLPTALYFLLGRSKEVLRIEHLIFLFAVILLLLFIAVYAFAQVDLTEQAKELPDKYKGVNVTDLAYAIGVKVVLFVVIFFVAPFLVYYGYFKNKIPYWVSHLIDWLYALGTAVIIAFLFYTTTRAAWLSIGVEFLVLAFLIIFSGWRYLNLSPNKIAATVGALLMFAFMAHLKQNFGNLDDGVSAFYSTPEVINIVAGEAQTAANSAGDSGYVRFVIWRGTWDLVTEKPLLGYGLGTFFYAYPDAFWVGAHGVRYAHNEFLEFMVELGFVGFSLLMLVMLISFYYAYRIIRATDDKYRIMLYCIMAGLIGTAVNSFFSFPYQHIPPYVMVASYLFLLMALYEWKVKGDGTSKNFSIGKSIELPINKALLVVAPLAGFSVFMIAMNLMWQSKIDAMNDNIWSIMRKTGPWEPIELPKAEWQQLPNYNWIYQGAATGYSRYPEISFNAAKTLHNAYPRNYIINTLLYTQYMKQGKKALAKKHIDQAIALSPRGTFQPEFMKIEGLLLPDKKFAEARELLEQIASAPEEELNYSAANYAALGNIYMKMKDQDKAVEYFTRANDVFTKISADELQAINAGDKSLTAVTMEKLKHWSTSQNLAVGYKTFNMQAEMTQEWARTRLLKLLWQTLSKGQYEQTLQVFKNNETLMKTAQLENEPVVLAAEIVAIDGQLETNSANLDFTAIEALRAQREEARTALYSGN